MMIEMERQLPEVLAGKLSLNPAQRVDFAQLAALTKRWTVSAQLYAQALVADDKLQVAHRYNAACSAVLAAGQGVDAALSDQQRRALRRRALTWLRADLAAWDGALSGRPPAAASVGQQMRHWQTDPDLAGLRDAEALKSLSAEERPACAKLWADVETLLKSVTSPSAK